MNKLILSSALAFGLLGGAFAQSTSDRTTPNGTTIDTTRDGNGNISKTVTGPGGKTTTVNKSVNMQGGTGTVDKTVTGPNGRTATVDKNVNMSHGVGTIDKTATGPNGKTISSTSTLGERGTKTTVTGPNGGTKTYPHRRRAR